MRVSCVLEPTVAASPHRRISVHWSIAMRRVFLMFQLVGCRFIECGLLPMAFTLVVLCGCGGSSTPSSQLSVGGSYSTRVTLLPTGNTCGNVTVQDTPTVVTHSPGASTLSLTHANNTYQGTISSTAQFSTTPTTISG